MGRALQSPVAPVGDGDLPVEDGDLPVEVLVFLMFQGRTVPRVWLYRGQPNRQSVSEEPSMSDGQTTGAAPGPGSAASLPPPCPVSAPLSQRLLECPPADPLTCTMSLALGGH